MSRSSDRQQHDPVAAPPVHAGLAIPSRSSVRASPLLSPRVLLLPIETDAADALWDAIEGSRWHLERWLPWVPYNNSPEAVVRYAEACVADWDAGRALRFVIRHRETYGLLGVVSLDSCVHVHRSCDLGYWLRREATGQGLMTEAARTAADYAFHRLGVHRIRCAAATDNHASLKVIARLGFRFEGIARQAEFVATRWLDHAVFARLSTDET